MYVRDSLEDKSMLLVHFKDAFPLTLLEQSFERKEELTDYCFFKNLPRYSLFLHQAK